MAVALLSLAVVAYGGPAAESSEATLKSHSVQGRQFSVNYAVELRVPNRAQGTLDVFIPLAQTTSRQRIIKRELISNIGGIEKIEPLYDNRFWYAHVDHAEPGQVVKVSVRYEVERWPYVAKPTQATKILPNTKRSLFLKPNKKVPTSGRLLKRVLADIPKPSEDTIQSHLKAAYTYVIDTMEYKKVGVGWGNGDTYWACSEKYGNCTDYHALLISLARAQNIAARFSIGLPVPEDRSEARIEGYHCWVDAWLPGTGWFPMDASEEDKNPGRDLFGKQPADRMQFTVGRDIELGEGHTTGPLNYFIYPHVELGGQKFSDVRTRFSYHQL